MDQSHELRLILGAIRDRRIDADQALELATQWSPSLHPSFLEYLAALGVLSTEGANPVDASATITVSTPIGPVSSSDPTLSSHAPSTTLDAHDHSYHSTANPGGRRYEPIRLHRTGGLGQVWLARDTVLDREVALKVIRPDRVGIFGHESRFVREAQVTSRLEHPGIVPLYDFIEDDAGWAGPCYVMRFVDGSTLAEVIAAYHARRKKGTVGPLELRTLLDAFIAVCQSVAFAHSRGVLHRDLKGHNVVLGNFGEVFLLDWGLNKGIDGDSTDPIAGGSHDTGIVGTPAYMAPEVVDGNPSTRASDVYGLGAILYNILTGKAPVDGPTPDAILRKVRSEDPTPPRVVNPSTSASLEAICRKSMARDPGSRYESAESLAADVRRWLADEPVSARRDPWPTRLGRWARRHRTGVASAAVLLVAAVLGLSIGGGLLWREQRKTSAEWRRAEKNLDASQLLTIRLVEVTEKLLPTVRGSELARLDLTRAAVDTFRLFAEQRPDSAEVRRWNAQLHRYEANLHRLLDQTPEAEAAYRMALESLRDDPRNADRLAETLRDRAGLLARLGRLKQALSDSDEALALAGKLRNASPDRFPTHRIEATIHLDRSAIELALGRFDDAVASAGRALGLLDGLIAADPNSANCYDSLLQVEALTARAIGERERAGYDSASPLIRDARGRMKALVEGRASGTNLDDALFAQAILEYQASRTWLRDSKQDLRPNAATNLGLVIVRLTDLASRHRDIPIYRDWLARARFSLGEIRELQGRRPEARKEFEAARVELDRLVADSPQIPDHRANLGRVHLGLGRLLEAEGKATDAGSDRKRGLDALRAALVAAPDDVEIRRDLDAALNPGPPQDR